MINSGLKLGELIVALKKFKPEEFVRFNFGGSFPTGIDSYRGFYEDLAIGFSDGNDGLSNVGELVVLLEDSIGRVFEGWKGGSYRATAGSTVWVANRGCTSGTVIKGIVQHEGILFIRAAHEDEEYWE